MLFLTLIPIGMAAGWVAHLIVGHGRNSWGADLVVGLLGSLACGVVVSVLVGDGLHLRLTGIFGSIAGAVLVLAVWQLITARRPQPAAHSSSRSSHHSSKRASARTRSRSSKGSSHGRRR